MQLVDKQEEIGINEIASHIQVSHNTASEHAKRMIEKGRDPHDERKVILYLTNLGEEVLHRNTSLDADKLEQVLNQLDEDEKNLVEHALKILSERAKQCM